jgi:hypothetical protein
MPVLKEILYTTALDKEGNLVFIGDAAKESQYICPSCKNPFILRKSGKSGKGSRRPHFAHNEISPNCTPESVLHYSFKKLLIDLLNKHKAENKPFTISWNCNNCHENFSGNLLFWVNLIKEEFDLTDCRPDIALLGEKGNVFAVIEIVVTHQPEPNVLEFYKKNNITLIQLNLSSDEDLKRVEEKIANPDLVDLCLNFNKCPNYSTNRVARNLIFTPLRCTRCYRLFGKLDHLNIIHPFNNLNSTNYDKKDIEFAKLNGIRIGISCPNCEILRNRPLYPRRHRWL